MPTIYRLLRLSAFTVSICLLLSGCIFKADVQQGNVLDADDIEKLEPGLSKRQVLVLLGSPSIADPFHQDRWDYVSTYSRRGTSDITSRQLLLVFERDELVSIEGDYLDTLTVADDIVDEIVDGDDDEFIAPLPAGTAPQGLPTTPSDGDGGGLTALDKQSWNLGPPAQPLTVNAPT